MLETRRLLLRQFNSKDWVDVLAYGSQKEVASNANFTPLATKRDAFAFVQYLRQIGIYALEDKQTAKVIGNIGAFPIIKPDGTVDRSGLEVGYALNQDFWGQGYMTEALIELCAFEQLQGILFLRARVFQENESSKKVLLKAGFRQRGQREIFNVCEMDQKKVELLFETRLTQD
ncbi:hypothetical protein LFYK43_22940 [Ligilactobacillus salitolerans]|uniref:N-acetyltransferase domain-containing protein n=1 Tax=Ligilactobacillus salitolerans TaxID=1808352 RepID=A0A401IWF5_9LACO|nr:GNAT family N-acetyltransferase [Ligilactobacillus salitolerans]GBG95835.1 hypothetical protein LFYK43_22940 [Ligilactobacillus salitolerans]